VSDVSSPSPHPADARHLLVIGAGPGIGAATARRFTRDGYRVTLVARHRERYAAVQALHAEGTENVFVQRRDDEPVLQRITGARRPLGAIVDHPPSAVGRAGEIARVQVKVSFAMRLDAAARPKIIIVSMKDRRRD